MGIFDVVKNLLNNNQSPAPATTTAPKTKVLIVEDDKAILDVYVDFLLGEGFDVMIAANGQEGLTNVQTFKPNIIVLDLLMPIMDGKTMLRKLREIPEFQNLPVIILTNQGDVETIKETKLFGNASDFLIKANITPADLVEKIKSHTGTA